ncbi:MAG: hypothetical protein ABMB14_21120, partial [Myxococcota bacterium]
MSLRTVFPLWIVELRRPGGAPKIVPLMVPAPFAIGRTVDQVAAELRRAITEDWMDHGRYAALLSAVFTGPPDTASIELALPQVDLLRPGLRLRFDAVVGPTTSGWAAFAPAIDAEGAGPTRSDAIDRVREAILDQVARLDLREDPRRIAEVQWWTELALHRVDLELDWWTFPERRRRAEERARHEGRLLAACADPMGPDRAYELGSARAELRRVVLGRVTAGVVVVG